MRRPLFRAAFRYRAAGHVAWSGSFRRRSVLGFPSRDAWARHCDQRFTRVTVLLSTPFPTALVGFQMFALRRFAPAMRMRRVSPPTRTHLPFASSSVAVFLLRDRPARKYQMGAFCRSRFRRRASSAARWLGMMTNDARRVGRSRMAWFGFWVLCVPPPAIHAPRRSSCSRRVILPWAWSSIRFERCEPPRYSACTNGRARMVRRVPSIARRRFDPARIRSWALRQ